MRLHLARNRLRIPALVFATALVTALTPAVEAQATAPFEIENGSFETGDLTGWQVLAGTAFSNAGVTDADDWGWGCCFNRDGDFHYWGFASGGDEATGRMRSSTFTLGGTGQITFKLGGGDDIDNLHVALIRAADGAELMRATNTAFDDTERLNPYSWDASAHLGQELYLLVVDTATGGWGHLNLDDVRTDIEVGASGEPVAYWPFDEGSGATARDVAGGIDDRIAYVFNDAQFKPSSDPLWNVQGPGHGVLSNALLFDGYSTSIRRPAGQMPSPTGGFSIEAWVAPRAYEWGDEGKPSAIVNQHDRGASRGFLLGMGRHGHWTFQAGINGSWQEVHADDSAVLQRNEWAYIVATFDPSARQMRLYKNGQLVGTRATPAGTITPSSQDFLIGLHNQAVVLNGTFTLNMFAGLIDEVTIRHEALSATQVTANWEAALSTFAGGTVPVPDMELDRTRYEGDKHRPLYHYTAPEHWMNEPHAPVYACGEYHLFFQQNQHGPYWHNISWGHQTSPDLVSWVDQPTAIVPTEGSVTPDGVWSGSAVTGPDGRPVLFITAGDDSVFPNQRTGLARGDCGDINDWRLHPDPVTVQDPNLDVGPGRKVRFGEFRDPFVWEENGIYYQLVASGVVTDSGADVGGTALLYSSANLVDWAYHGPLFTGDVGAYPKTGQVWELPVFLPIGGGKHALLINPWWSGPNEHNTKFVWYWVGEWDATAKRFTPDHEEPRLFDYGEHFSGPSGFVDQQGRSVVFSITQDRRTERAHYDAGWAHNAGLPIELYLRGDGDLGVRPLAEMANLHSGAALVNIGTDTTFAAANQQLASVDSDSLHIRAELSWSDARHLGITVRKTPSGSEQTVIGYDRTAGELYVDRTRSGTVSSLFTNLGVQRGPLPSAPGERVVLDIFVDKSMIEIYANGHKSITTRAYPGASNAGLVELFADGGATVHSLKVWQMASAY
jgi:sucrose-6-phosphate hydrolase SacC (GH32 family)